jgi:N utilization substance protein B
MLSRRYLRVKTFQAIFAFRVSQNEDLVVGTKNLLHNLDKLHELLIYQLSFLIALSDFAEKRISENKKKHIPSEEDLNPNLRFVNNRISKLLKSNVNLQREIENCRISWKDEEPMIRKLHSIILESKTYKSYLNSVDSFESDKSVWVKIIKNQLSHFDPISFYYEDLNSIWIDDINIVNHLMIKFIKSFNEFDDEKKEIPELFYDYNHTPVPEDKQFITDLFEMTVLAEDENIELIRSKVQNWELERIAISDMIILEMGVTELLKFPTIPIKVTLNEYIELAKMFSTPNSHIFVNGVLDRLIAQLLKENKIHKTGRGLIDKSISRDRG